MRTRLVVGTLKVAVIVGIAGFPYLRNIRMPHPQPAIRIETVLFGRDQSNDRNFLLIAIRNVGNINVTIKTIYLYRDWEHARSGKNFTMICTATNVDYEIGVCKTKNLGLTDHTAWNSTIISTIPDKLVGISFNEDLRTSTKILIKILTSDVGFSVEASYDTPSSW